MQLGGNHLVVNQCHMTRTVQREHMPGMAAHLPVDCHCVNSTPHATGRDAAHRGTAWQRLDLATGALTLLASVKYSLR
jgi:hypothetical protein